MSEWPGNWADLIRGVGCEMCGQGRPESDAYGVRIHEGQYSDAYLQRADVQRGYTIVIWRGRHVTEPTELSEAEAAGYWAEVLTVARALIGTYRPLKMNYETLGNSLPHLHTHLIPRFPDDPRPGQPFPLSATAPRGKIPEARLIAEATDLRHRLGSGQLQPALFPGYLRGVSAVAGA
jgi:diadenosine tetraphosphate (Ap4A) HIT family hydrolase